MKAYNLHSWSLSNNISSILDTWVDYEVHKGVGYVGRNKWTDGLELNQSNQMYKVIFDQWIQSTQVHHHKLLWVQIIHYRNGLHVHKLVMANYYKSK